MIQRTTAEEINFAATVHEIPDRYGPYHRMALLAQR